MDAGSAVDQVCGHANAGGGAIRERIAFRPYGPVTAEQIARCIRRSKKRVQQMATEKGWDIVWENSNGGPCMSFWPHKLPVDIQIVLARSSVTLDYSLLHPEAQAVRSELHFPVLNIAKAIDSPTIPQPASNLTLTESQSKNIQIVNEALNRPREYQGKNRKWIEIVGLKHGRSRAQVYRLLKDYGANGIDGLRHSKPTRDKALGWDDEALKYWIGLCLKRGHRKLNRKTIYNTLFMPEADKRDWRYGKYPNANKWANRLITPQLKALQNGGRRALDNILPPVLRDYSDLQPFEIICGDQHRWDFWVVDPETGEVFRPECYAFVDLGTRCFYGAALAKKYNSALIGLSLRVGVKTFGVFGGLYSDNGKPELSGRVADLLRELSKVGVSPKIHAGDLPDCDEKDAPDQKPGIPHRKAIVRNAKAKLIERVFREIERIMVNDLMVPGYCKRLSDRSEWQEIDDHEVKQLAAAGKLITFPEFYRLMFEAMQIFNTKKPHRGILKEWRWKPRPREATPMDCLLKHYEEGWRPFKLSDEVADLVFLPEANRSVVQGRVEFNKEKYEHERLAPLTGQVVRLKYNPADPRWVLVFDDDSFICRAEPVEYSSMKDQDLASRKIREKRSLERICVDEYQALTCSIPDCRTYSTVSPADKAVALIGRDKRKRAEANAIIYSVPSKEEAAAAALPEPQKHMPGADLLGQFKEREQFKDSADRFAYIRHKAHAGFELTPEECEFYHRMFFKLDQEAQEQFKFEHELLKIDVIMDSILYKPATAKDFSL